MGIWGTSIFSDDMAMDIRREYSILLSVGKDNEIVEQMLTEYYSSIMNCDDPDEDVFWFALALCEWKKGRLSDYVKNKALCALDSGKNLNYWHTTETVKNYEKRKKVLDELQNTLLSPMPPVKKIKKPTVHHCPWKTGDLLAYRIISNAKSLSNHPNFKKYVLLRVVRIEKNPISKLFDTGYYDETMLVGLYDWIGNEIPDPIIVRNLPYIPVEEPIQTQRVNMIDCSLMDSLQEESRTMIQNQLSLFFQGKIEKCVWLDWRSCRDARGDITLLDCDEAFGENIPDFFKPELDSRTYTGLFAFDITLAKRFERQGRFQ